MTAQEKMAYIKGLIAGLELNDSNEAKVIKELVEAMDIMAEDIENIKDDVFDLNEYTEAMDEDIYDIEEDLYGDDEDFDDDEYAEFPCPNCGEIICLEEEDFCEDTIKCPSCGYEIDFDDCCDDDCDCCDCEDCK